MLTMTVAKRETYDSKHTPLYVPRAPIVPRLSLLSTHPPPLHHVVLLCLVAHHSLSAHADVCHPTLTPVTLLTCLGSYPDLECLFFPSSFSYLLCNSTQVSPLPRSLSRVPSPSSLDRLYYTRYSLPHCLVFPSV